MAASGRSLPAARLIYSLFENLGPWSSGPARPRDLSPRAFGDLVAGALHAWIAIQHDVHAARWDSQTPELIRRYLEFFAAMPRSAGTPPVLVFMNVIFRRPDASAWRSLAPLSAVLASRAKKQM